MRSNPDQTMAEFRSAMKPRPSARIARNPERPFDHVPTYPRGAAPAYSHTDDAGRTVTIGPDGETVRTMPDFAPDGTEAWQYIGNPAERDAAEYRSLVNHLVNVHGLKRDAVTRVAYDLRGAKRLHAMQR